MSHLVEPEVLHRVIAHGLRRGGEFAEVFVEDRRSASASLDQQRVQELSSSRDRGAGVRVVVGQTTGFAHTTDLSEAGLARAAEAAASIARSSGGTEKMAAFESPRSYDHVAEIDPETVDIEERLSILRHLDESARAHSSVVSQVQAGVATSARQFTVANSEGVVASNSEVRTRAAVSVICAGDGSMQTGYVPIAATRGFEILTPESVELAALSAVDQAVTKLSARPAPSGPLPVVLAGGSGGILFHEACGHGLEADAVVKSASVYAGRIGQRVASELVTLVDDGSRIGEWGYQAIDDEGRVSGAHTLIENGVLTDYMWDGLRARQERRHSSGNGRRQSYEHLPMVRMTNTYLRPGVDDPDDIIASTKYGIYIARLGGGQVNTTTGDFVFGATSAYLIENGRITAPLRECNLIGNGPDVLSRVDAVAGDFSMSPGTCGKDGQSVPVGCGQATMRVNGITIGGTA